MYELIQVSGSSYYVQSPAKIGLVRLNDTDVCFIDSGSDKDAGRKARQILDKNGWRLTAIDNTHSHGDHIGGHARIKELAPQIRTACIEQAAPALRDPAANAVRIRTKYPRFSPPPQCYLRGVEPDRVLRDGEALGDRLTVLHTPGHDGDCVCWYDRKTKTAVTGDSLQANGTVTQGIAFYQDLDAYLGSVAKLRTCDVENIIAGHDYAGMGYNIEGAENVRRVLDLCDAYTEQYQRFVDEALSCGLTDTSVMAAQMITQLGCGMPQKRFLAMYTTDEHIRHSKFYKGELK